jgi:hypothetical protein
MGRSRVRNKGGFLVWEKTVFCSYLASLVASNQVWG